MPGYIYNGLKTILCVCFCFKLTLKRKSVFSIAKQLELNDVAFGKVGGVSLLRVGR